MKKRKNHSEPQKEDTPELSKNYPEEFVDVEIEKNFIIRTNVHDRSRLEKWKMGRRNFS